MPRRFLPTLTTASKSLATKPDMAIRDVSVKEVLSDYYNALNSAGLYAHNRTRPWPVERAVAEAYERLVWVFKSVEAISGHASRLPVRLKNGEDVLDDHPLYRVLNKRANPLETGRQFRKRLSAQILLSKRGAFVELTRSRGGTIVRMDLLPPGRTRPVPGRGQELVSHYEVLRTDGTTNEIPTENVRWFREPHPIDPYCGVTPLEAAGLSVELDFFTRLYNVSFMRNDARPGGIVGVDGEMDEGEMDRVESRFGKGPVEAGKLTVINGKLSYVDLAARPRDMQYEATSRSAKIEILAAFGVGESVLGYAAERTFDNADAELYNFWTITMPPHLDLLATGFDEDSDDELETFLDTEDVEALQRAKKARRQEMRDEFDRGLVSPDEYREEAGYDRVDNYQTRALYIPSGKTPVPTSDKDAESFGLGPATPPPPALGAEPPPEAPPAAPPGTPQPPPAPAAAPSPPRTPAAPAATGQRKPEPPPAGRKTLRLVSSARTKTDPVATKASGELVSEPDPKDRDKLEAALAAALAALAVRLAERAVARVAAPKTRKGTRHWVAQYEIDTRIGVKALDAARVVDEDKWQEEAEQTAAPIVGAAAAAAAAALFADLAPDSPDPPAPTSAGTVVAEVIALIGASAAAQAHHLVGIINDADQQGATVEEIQQRVREHERNLTAWADGVAAQAATATVSGARDAAAQALADDDPTRDILRMWRSRKDAKVRFTHERAHGQHQPLGELFEVGPALLRFPGDPLGPPGETYNCRCRLQHRSKRSGQFMSKPKELAATGTDTYAVKRRLFDESQVRRDTEGQFAVESGGGESLTGKAAYAVAPKATGAPLTKDESQAVRRYTGGAYVDANDLLRGADDIPDAQERRARQLIGHLDRVFEKTPELSKPIVVARTVAGAEQIFGPVGSRIGDGFTDPAFVSTTTGSLEDLEFVTRGDARLNIRVPAGGTVVAPGDLGRAKEQEVLLNRGSRFRITDDRRVDGERVIDLDYLPGEA